MIPLPFFGQSFSNDSISSTSVVFTLSTIPPTSNFMYNTFDPTKAIISYSQVPPDATKTSYYTFYLWVNITEFPDHMVHAAYFNGSMHFEIPCNWSLSDTNFEMRIAATNSPNVYAYIYGTYDNQLWQIMNQPFTCMNLNVTKPPTLRLAPALVGYNNGFLMHGGRLQSGTIQSELWQFNGDNTPTWSMVNSNLFTAATHTAVISILPPTTTASSNVTIYFTNFGMGPSAGVYMVSFDLMSNMTYFHYNDSTMVPVNRIGSLSSVIGNTFFYFLGKDNENYYNDYYRFVDEKYCTSIMDCEVCVGIFECGWCSAALANGPNCVAGNQTKSGGNRLPIVSDTCAHATVLLSVIESCPELFPSWAIALIVIGGVILVGGIVFGIMKLRAKPGYDPV